MTETNSFFERPNVRNETIQIGKGIPFAFESVTNSALGVGGAYGTWGDSYDNARLRDLVSYRR